MSACAGGACSAPLALTSSSGGLRADRIPAIPTSKAPTRSALTVTEPDAQIDLDAVVPDLDDDVPEDDTAEPDDADIDHSHPDPDELLDWGDEERQG